MAYIVGYYFITVSMSHNLDACLDKALLSSGKTATKDTLLRFRHHLRDTVEQAITECLDELSESDYTEVCVVPW